MNIILDGALKRWKLWTAFEHTINRSWTYSV